MIFEIKNLKHQNETTILLEFLEMQEINKKFIFINIISDSLSKLSFIHSSCYIRFKLSELFSFSQNNLYL